MKKKLVSSILVVIIIVCVLALCLSACNSDNSDNSEKKGKYKESLVYITGFAMPYVLISYTIDNNGIMTINAYKFHGTYDASVEQAEEVQIVTHVSNVKIRSEEEIENY